MPTEDVELGYLAHAKDGPHPGVVLIHDVWGLSDHTRDLARRLAAKGFAVLALDLYRREESLHIDDPGRWMRALSDPQVLEDIERAAAFLSGDPACAGRRIGALGFCMGGMYALLAGCEARGLSAVVPFYGILSHQHGLLHCEGGLDPALKPSEPLEAVRDLSVPLLAFFGDEDSFIPMDDVRLLEERMAGAPHFARVVVFPGAGHAFANDTRPDAYRPEAAREAWARMVVFFQECLA
jgi:carboxymethylenebutenolidase